MNKHHRLSVDKINASFLPVQMNQHERENELTSSSNDGQSYDDELHFES